MSAWRDKAAWRICNFVLHTLATKDYRDKLYIVISTGLIWLRPSESQNVDNEVDK